MDPLKYISMSTTKDIWAQYEDHLWDYLAARLDKEFPGATVLHRVLDQLEIAYAEDTEVLTGYLVFSSPSSC